MEQAFLIEADEIAELRRIAELIRKEQPELAKSLEEIARAASNRRVIDDTCY